MTTDAGLNGPALAIGFWNTTNGRRNSRRKKAIKRMKSGYRGLRLLLLTEHDLCVAQFFLANEDYERKLSKNQHTQRHTERGGGGENFTCR